MHYSLQLYIKMTITEILSNCRTKLSEQHGFQFLLKTIIKKHIELLNGFNNIVGPPHTHTHATHIHATHTHTHTHTHACLYNFWSPPIMNC